MDHEVLVWQIISSSFEDSFAGETWSENLIFRHDMDVERSTVEELLTHRLIIGKVQIWMMRTIFHDSLPEQLLACLVPKHAYLMANSTQVGPLLLA